MGNDVVDLGDPANRGKSGDDRFLARVFTDQERDLIAGAAAPDALLWSLWAAKEAAYKAIGGGDAGLISSVPRRYPVHLDNYPPVEHQIPEVRSGDFSGTPAPAAEREQRRLSERASANSKNQHDEAQLISSLQRSEEAQGRKGSSARRDADVQLSAGLLTGRVITPRGAVALRIAVAEDYVHALALAQDTDFAGIVHRVDRMDGGENPGDASAFVRRQLLTEISRRLSHPLDDLLIRTDPSGSGAPRLFLRDRPLPMEISLSHDGRFTAFAFRAAPFSRGMLPEEGLTTAGQRISRRIEKL